ncbi:hypothetical protein JAAARDRAFT_546806 [Jaapia argillacea MUCL 33604]|uniref:F-box domain-containing protein n=1 Tax=Jaapia argillacea MUCL 33604 TaxID=933084 RepID=A0A067PIU0_9AGAM|nr:hypothetical protein JAAARDRAFT_546806 [Jaapia argillacea MUCL 33604]
MCENSESTGIAINNDIFDEIWRFRPAPLFPMLRGLYWTHHQSGHSSRRLIAGLLPFTTQSLRSLHLESNQFDHWSLFGTDGVFQMFLDDLPRRTPLLKTLILAGCVADLSFDFFVGLPHLGNLVISFLQDLSGAAVRRMLAAIARLLPLQSLVISGVEAFHLLPNFTLSGFPSLRSITLRSCDATSALRLTEMFANSPLLHYELWVNWRRWRDSLTCLELVTNAHPNLVKFWMTSTAHSASATRTEGHEVAMALLESLLILRRLEELTLSVPVPSTSTLKPDFVRKMALAWPKIRVMHLESETYSFTLHTLPLFVSLCPTLTSLHVYSIVDLEQQPTPLLSSPSFHQLRVTARVQDCEPDDLQAALQFLFPRLEAPSWWKFGYVDSHFGYTVKFGHD